MNLWTMLVYGGAAVIALSGLFALMTAHRQQSLHRYFEEELQRRQEEAAQQHKAEMNKQAAEKSPAPTAGRTKAA